MLARLILVLEELVTRVATVARSGDPRVRIQSLALEPWALHGTRLQALDYGIREVVGVVPDSCIADLRLEARLHLVVGHRA